MKPACWNCFCNRCKAELDVCGDDCLALMRCGAMDLTSKASELGCEGRGFAAKCLNDPATASGLTAILNFDLCSISHHQPSEQLRSCEKECAMTFSDDLCERYPAPDAG